MKYERVSGGIEGIPALVSSLDPAGREEFLRRCSAGPGDLILFAVGHRISVNKTLDRLRLYVANELGLVDPVSSCLHILISFMLIFTFHFH